MLKNITFIWDDQYGNCDDCSNPAAFYSTRYGNKGPKGKLCAVCAANDAVDGETITRIEDEVITEVRTKISRLGFPKDFFNYIKVVKESDRFIVRYFDKYHNEKDHLNMTKEEGNDAQCLT